MFAKLHVRQLNSLQEPQVVAEARPAVFRCI